MSMEAAEYQWWRDALAGKVAPIHDGDPMPGFYRIKRKNKQTQEITFAAVAYWKQDGQVRCHVNGQDLPDLRAMELWPYASKTPVAWETYDAVMKGAGWPDMHEGATQDRSNSAAMPPDDSYEGLKDRIENLCRDAEALLKKGAAQTQDDADQASDLANRLGELQKKADAARAAEKKPHDDAAKAVQAKWSPVIAAADVYRRIKASVITPFLAEQDRKRRAAEDQQRRAEVEAARAGAPPPEPPPAAVAPVKAGSGSRRSVALRTVKDVEIEDRAKVLEFFKDNEQVTALLKTLAERAVRAGVDVPGAKIIERKVAA
jgi:hypothetical protein